MSASMFITTAAVPVTRKKAMTGPGSTWTSPVRKSSPMPFHPKTVSVRTAPPMRPAKSKATIVVIGMRALRKACLVMTTRSDRPLDRAVRT